MKKHHWINRKIGHKPSFSEIRIGNMLDLLQVQFEHLSIIAGHEVDFLVKRYGKKGIFVTIY